jgi:hypothetical protein
LEIAEADLVATIPIVHLHDQFDVVDQGARPALLVFNDQALQVVDRHRTLVLAVCNFEKLLKLPCFCRTNLCHALAQVLVRLLQVQMSLQQALKDLLSLEAHSFFEWSTTHELLGKDLVSRDNHGAELSVVDETISIGVVTNKEQLRLVAIVHFVANKAVKAFREVSLRQVALAAEVEYLEGSHAGKVLFVGQLTFQLLYLLFEVYLIKQGSGELLLDSLLCRKSFHSRASLGSICSLAKLIRSVFFFHGLGIFGTLKLL